MPKTAEMQAALDAMFPEQAANIKAGKCAICARDINPDTEFRDELSKREFEISGLCQICQDSVFENPSE